MKTISTMPDSRNVVHILPVVPFHELPPPSSGPLEVVVLFLKMQGTLEALEMAATLAKGLHARFRMIVLREVPYSLPLSEPAVSNEFAEHQFFDFVSNLRDEVKLDIYLCRNRNRELLQILRPHSLIILCTKKGWWPTPEKKLASHLKKHGHQVLLVPISK
jgi:hypothetical protein